MSRLSRFADLAVDDSSVAENRNDHRIKMYKELRRGGPQAAKTSPLSVGDSLSSSAAPTPVSPSGEGLDPKSERP